MRNHLTTTLATSVLAGLLCTPGAWAASAKDHSAAKPASLQSRQIDFEKYVKALPPYVSVDTIEKIRQRRKELGLDSPFLQPMVGGEALPPSLPALPGAEPYILGNSEIAPDGSLNGKRFAQAPLLPAPVPSSSEPTIPHWVRYPLEFQLCGIGIGIHAVDKDQYNRIDRYGLFAIHGNPTAIVVPAAGGNGSTVTTQQQPPEVAALFPGSQGGGLPNWAEAITVSLDNNHVEWLYRRSTYSMGFVVDRLGYVDAVVVAGTHSPIAKTQMEDPLHSVQLGDDLRKVLYRYGYPDTIETYGIIASAATQTAANGEGGAGGGGAGAGAGAPGGGPGGGAPGAGGPGGAGGAGGAAGGGGQQQNQAVAGNANAATRTFEFRYEQSYNVVFTIKNNRVVRIYIFGDPDFFNDARRQQLRNSY